MPSQDRRADAVDQSRENLPREVSEMRAALALLRDQPAEVTDDVTFEAGIAFIEQLREVYSRLDVDELFDAVRAVSHGAATVALLESEPLLSALKEHVEKKLEKRMQELRVAVDHLGKRFDADGCDVLEAVARVLEKVCTAS